MKYKTGDQVRVKPREWFEALEIIDEMRMTPGGECILQYHEDAAGQVSQIASGRETAETSFYKLRGHSYFFPEEALDPEPAAKK